MGIEISHSTKSLLFGNGLLRSFGGNSWDELLKRITVRDDIPEELKSPMPLQAILRSNNRIEELMKKNKSDFFGNVTDDEQRLLLQKLLMAGFDDIFTTNYSYELEIVAVGSDLISEYALKKNMRHTSDVDHAETKYLLHTWQQVGINRVWHIHGEARKPGSMILGHYIYAELLHRYKKYLDDAGNKFLINQNKNTPCYLHSWIDSFILGDVYCLGFGFDLSEFDLWWLLNRKAREKAKKGKVYFYAPGKQEFNETVELLKVLDVKPVNLGIVISSNDSEAVRDEKYRQFYRLAVEDIANLVSQG